MSDLRKAAQMALEALEWCERERGLVEVLDAVGRNDVVADTMYWYGLFSHQRDTFMWKGLVTVPLMSDDVVALAALEAAEAADAQEA